SRVSFVCRPRPHRGPRLFPTRRSSDLAPGIDHQRMAVGLAAALVPAALRRRQYEAAVLDGAGAVEHLPMRLAGLLRERGRHRKRSEEHTSELQSRENLVCRLLLEKKNE